MSAKQFWADVFSEEERLRKEIQARIRRYREGDKTALGLQPEHGQSVFIESLPSRVNRMSSGAVCECKFALASQRLCEGSHKLAEPESIARFLELQEQNRRTVEAMESKSANRRVISLRGDE